MLTVDESSSESDCSMALESSLSVLIGCLIVVVVKTVVELGMIVVVAGIIVRLNTTACEVSIIKGGDLDIRPVSYEREKRKRKM